MLNAAAYGVDGSVRTAQEDVRDADLAGVDAVFIDPARRTDGSAGRRAGRSPGQRRLGPGARRTATGLVPGPPAGRVPAVGIKAALRAHREWTRCPAAGKSSSSPSDGILKRGGGLVTVPGLPPATRATLLARWARP